MRPTDDLIAALATPPGYAGLAVIRVSGPGSIEKVAGFLTQPGLEKAAGNTLHYSKFAGHDKQIIDEVICAVFRSPKSFTTEDTVEISCHGGPVLYQAILQELFRSGVRPADPGEFTQRAYLNGRIDLAQAEAIADLIHSSTQLSRQASLYQLSGSYSKKLASLRAQLIHLISLLELELDFSEEDVEFASREDLLSRIDDTTAYLSNLMESYLVGRIIRDGIRLVIAGKPNAGKSTLLNTLTGEDRAIVTDIPGTTRDTLDVQLSLGGLRFIVTDTAGLRETTDIVERLGVERTHEAIRQAAVLIYLIDNGVGPDENERAFINQLKQDHPQMSVLVVASKSDQPGAILFDRDCQISARTGEGMEVLTSLLIRTATGDRPLDAAAESVTNARHFHAMEAASRHLTEAKHAIQMSVSPDFISADIRRAINCIGEITGEVTTDEILGHIFSSFCIGK
ncbi:MAG: tRNA uridine-5-carboxymethylaminomethyl(34) synthesis GTPase MnmE [Bacteroidetes bacterium]|nr:tRNA uridine-5-carboxymethylaminomethyl(34) synthesis GTPase MnmE [Bacteroidota bacterium]